MGLLDDAIREHLDLKRRRGADPAEVARLEQEALGPVRREPAPAEAAEDHPPSDAGEPAPAAPAEAQAAGEGLPADDRTRVLEPSERHEGAHGDPLRAPEAPGAHEPDAAVAPEQEPAAQELAPPAAPDPPATEDPRSSDIVHQPTTEFRVEDHQEDEDAEQSAPERPPAADDVLEETPDFLQETPEHDRLWFEQRPPRDFDFDG